MACVRALGRFGVISVSRPNTDVVPPEAVLAGPSRQSAPYSGIKPSRLSALIFKRIGREIGEKTLSHRKYGTKGRLVGSVYAGLDGLSERRVLGRRIVWVVSANTRGDRCGTGDNGLGFFMVVQKPAASEGNTGRFFYTRAALSARMSQSAAFNAAQGSRDAGAGKGATVDLTTPSERVWVQIDNVLAIRPFFVHLSLRLFRRSSYRSECGQDSCGMLEARAERDWNRPNSSNSCGQYRECYCRRSDTRDICSENLCYQTTA
ncbi:hypothetical protein Bbelb_052790 [Branchiostoma belcheri]|nr:hypothetical protein Bbelb_052790 [Branchiostoma belcheri]